MTQETKDDLLAAVRDIDMKAALRLANEKCPRCRSDLVHYRWLRGCPDRSCGWYGVLQRRNPESSLVTDQP